MIQTKHFHPYLGCHRQLNLIIMIVPKNLSRYSSGLFGQGRWKSPKRRISSRSTCTCTYLKQVYLHLYVLDLKLVPTKEMTKGHLGSEIRSKSSFYIQRFRNKCHLLARVAFIWPSISPFFVSHLQSWWCLKWSSRSSHPLLFIWWWCFLFNF